MKILGIDPGTATTGWSIIEANGSAKPQLLYAGIISTKAHTPLPERLELIYRNAYELIKKYSPDTISIEKLFFARNTTTAISVAHARGVIVLAGAQHNLDVFEYTPLQVKMAITGYGRADKKQIFTILPSHIEGDIPKQDDACDAIAIAVTHATAARSGFLSQHQETIKN